MSGLLLATDVAARGLDIAGVDHVIHYQVPRTTEVRCGHVLGLGLWTLVRVRVVLWTLVRVRVVLWTRVRVRVVVLCVHNVNRHHRGTLCTRVRVRVVLWTRVRVIV